jgi:hypothetical protein
MVEGVDFGAIPGTGDKKVLLKPGAEKLAEVYGYAPEIEIEERKEEWQAQPPFFHYIAKARLVKKSTGVVVAEGVGSCNSMETKYRYRWENNWHDTKPEGDGWVQKPKRNGGGFFWSRRVINEDTADLANTILKMAKKRALVDATLSATRSSELFTQDLDDFTPESDATDAAASPVSKSKAKPPASATQCADCGGPIEDHTTKKTGRVTTAANLIAYSMRDYGRQLCYPCGWKAKTAKDKAVTEAEAIPDAEVVPDSQEPNWDS